MKHTEDLKNESWHISDMDDRHNPDGEGWEIHDGVGRVATVYGDEDYHLEQARLIADAPRLLAQNIQLQTDLTAEREKVRVLRDALTRANTTITEYLDETWEGNYEGWSHIVRISESALAATEPGA